MTTILFVPVSQTADLDGVIAKTGKTAFSPFDIIGQDKFENALAAGKFDDLLEIVYEKNQSADDIKIVKGVALTHGYASQVNEQIAHALDADVILVGADNDDALFAIAKQVFGERVVGKVKPSDDVASLIKTNNRPSRLSPSAFRSELVKKAQQAKKRIVLPEGAEPRTVEAAIICQTRGIANCILLATKDEVQAVADSKGLSLPADLEIIDPSTISEQYVAPMVERRKGKIDEAKAREELTDAVVLGTMMLHMGDVDGLVSGAVHTTANTIRPAFQLIKTAPQYSLVSSIFFMLLPEQVVVYGDCAVNPNPTAEQLAEIAIQSAQSAKAFGIEPKVAMISYSTMDSASGPDVDLVVEATRIVKEKVPELAVDGPLQYDAAVVPSVGKSKAPNSPVAGEANVFIFPSLSVGNALYKAVQRNANVLSVGPMLQGLNKPVNDLSRGCLMEDIIYTIALTAVQAVSDDV